MNISLREIGFFFSQESDDEFDDEYYSDNESRTGSKRRRTGDEVKVPLLLLYVHLLSRIFLCLFL